MAQFNTKIIEYLVCLTRKSIKNPPQNPLQVSLLPEISLVHGLGKLQPTSLLTKTPVVDIGTCLV